MFNNYGSKTFTGKKNDLSKRSIKKIYFDKKFQNDFLKLLTIFEPKDCF